MSMQIFNTQPDGLARTCAGNREGINQQPQLMIQCQSGAVQKLLQLLPLKELMIIQSLGQVQINWHV